MGNALSDQLTGINSATASGGLAGGPVQNRASDTGGRTRKKRFSFTIPASGAGSVSGDTVDLVTLFVTDRIYGVRLIIPVGLGAGVTMDIGKVDDNNSTNTDATHYMSGVDVSIATDLNASANIFEQVGADPAGDGSTGNTVPGFGSKKIRIQATIHGTPTAARTFVGAVEYQAE